MGMDKLLHLNPSHNSLSLTHSLSLSVSHTLSLHAAWDLEAVVVDAERAEVCQEPQVLVQPGSGCQWKGLGFRI